MTRRYDVGTVIAYAINVYVVTCCAMFHSPACKIYTINNTVSLLWEFQEATAVEKNIARNIVYYQRFNNATCISVEIFRPLVDIFSNWIENASLHTSIHYMHHMPSLKKLSVCLQINNNCRLSKGKISVKILTSKLQPTNIQSMSVFGASTLILVPFILSPWVQYNRQCFALRRTKTGVLWDATGQV